MGKVEREESLDKEMGNYSEQITLKTGGFHFENKMILKTEGYSTHQPQVCQENETGPWGL